MHEANVNVKEMATKVGFSLMEVNLAILMVALGLLSLFSLFPAGLRESQGGIMDTQEAMFADHVLSTLEGTAQTITNWSGWGTESAFYSNVLADCNYASAGDLGIRKTGVFPESGSEKIRYTLSIVPVPNTGMRRYRATLKVMSGTMGSFDDYGMTYYTEFIFCGM